MELSLIFAKNLRKARQRIGYTQKQLGEQLGYSEKAISKWECGGAIPPVTELVRLAAALHTTIDVLLSAPTVITHYLGIDGGGTKTAFLLENEQGEAVAEATLGAEIDIPTLEGEQKYNIPEGTQPGTQFTLRGKGIQNLNYPSRRGDLIFTAVVEIPKGLSGKQKEHMRAFAESCGESNYKKKTSFFKNLFN